MTTALDFTEFEKLVKELTKRNIRHEVRNLYDGKQVNVYDNNNNLLWDAVNHAYSYGAEFGLLEVMGSIVETLYNARGEEMDDEDVIGFVTAKQIIEVL